MSGKQVRKARQERRAKATPATRDAKGLRTMFDGVLNGTLKGEVREFPVGEMRFPRVEDVGQTPEELAEYVRFRLLNNLNETGHPLYHRAADGTVVDSDPTLETWLRKLGTMLPQPTATDPNYYETERGQAALLGTPYRDPTNATWGYGWLRFYDDPPSGDPATSEHDIAVDRKLLADINSCTPEEREAATVTGKRIVAERKYRPHDFFLVVQRTPDGGVQLLDDGHLAAVLEQRGITEVPTRVLTDLSEGQAAVIMSIIQARDLSAVLN